MAFSVLILLEGVVHPYKWPIQYACNTVMLSVHGNVLIELKDLSLLDDVSLSLMLRDRVLIVGSSCLT